MLKVNFVQKHNKKKKKDEKKQFQIHVNSKNVFPFSIVSRRMEFAAKLNYDGIA